MVYNLGIFFKLSKGIASGGLWNVTLTLLFRMKEVAVGRLGMI
jgi:hypothetical protein